MGSVSSVSPLSQQDTSSQVDTAFSEPRVPSSHPEIVNQVSPDVQLCSALHTAGAGGMFKIQLSEFPSWRRG